MKTTARIIRIGNSRGIRVPSALLQEAQLPMEVELQARPGSLIVRPARRRREGWEEAARTMRQRNEDQLLDPPTATQFDEEEWEWR